MYVVGVLVVPVPALFCSCCFWTLYYGAFAVSGCCDFQWFGWRWHVPHVVGVCEVSCTVLASDSILTSFASCFSSHWLGTRYFLGWVGGLMTSMFLYTMVFAAFLLLCIP